MEMDGEGVGDSAIEENVNSECDHKGRNVDQGAGLSRESGLGWEGAGGGWGLDQIAQNRILN